METKELLNISILDDVKQIEAIFNKALPLYTKSNKFHYESSQGYYEKNVVKLNVGFVFNTPSGRESKMYPYLKIRIKEDKNSGECNWLSDTDSIKKIVQKLHYYLDSTQLDLYFKGTPLKNKYDLGIKYFVVSHGSGGIPVFKLKKEDLETI